MESSAAGHPEWPSRPGRRRSYTDCDNRHSIISASDDPFSTADIGNFDTMEFDSCSEVADNAGKLHDADYFRDAQGPLAESYPASDMSWTQSVLAATTPSEQQPVVFEDLGSFFSSGSLTASSSFQPSLWPSTNNGDLDSYIPFEPSVAMNSEFLDHQRSRTPRQPQIKPQLRRQNHACDPCRSSKKACDLPRGVAVRDGLAMNPCTACEMRDLDCTISWLASRQLVRQGDAHGDCPSKARRRRVARAKAVQATRAGSRTTNTPQDLTSTSAQISSTEGHLSRKVVADEACSLKFNVYIDISDSFLSHCLVRGSMPLHFKFGIMAYDNLAKHTYLSAYVGKVEGWVASCWNGSAAETILPFPPGPCLLRAVSLLDALFLAAAPGSSRDAAITDAFRWVGIATAAQVDLGGQSRDTDGPRSGDGPGSHNRDFAVASWRKAKELIFANMAATRSFRLALALFLFGSIVTPSGTPPHSHTDEDSEDRDYAFCEGARRLRELCKHARKIIAVQKGGDLSSKSCGEGNGNGFWKETQFQQMPHDVCELVLELVGALEWLLSISNSVAVGVSYGKVCAIPVDVDVDMDGGEQAAISKVSSTLDQSTQESRNRCNVTKPLQRHFHQQPWEVSILRRARQGGVPFVDVLRSNIHDYDTVLYAGRLPIALAALTWRILARLTMAVKEIRTQSKQSNKTYENYEEVQRSFIAMVSHIDLWRTAFGTVDQILGSKLQDSHREVWRILAFCSVDTDLAILLFCDVSHKLEVELEMKAQLRRPSSPLAGDGDRETGGGAGDILRVLRSTRTYRAEQSLISAWQTAVVSSTCQGSSVTGSTGSPSPPQEPPSFGRYMCAHPNHWMLIQVHLLAMQAFSKEIKQLIDLEDTKRISELTWAMNTCFCGLSQLREILCIPAISLSKISEEGIYCELK